MKTKQTVLLALILWATEFSCFAQDGSLDLTFDNDGIVTTSIGTSEDFGRGMTVQSDGKIIVAGYSYTGTRDVCAVVRYNVNGSLDTTFDDDGIVTTPIGNSGNRAHAVALQNDGKILVAGYSWSGTDNDFALIRYNSNGSLDTTFDSDGIVTVNFGVTSNDRAFSVAVQSDDKIVVSGYNTNTVSNRDFASVRYQSNGTLDPTFGTNGIVSTPIALGGDEAQSVVIQNDGKILVAGFSFNFSTRVFALIRYNSNGTLDNSFDSDGIATTSISNNDDAGYSVALQSDGKIVVAGYTHGATYDFASVRYNSNGSLDTTFDTDGIVTTSIGTAEDLASAVTLQNDGKIVVAGKSSQISGSDNNFALVRYTANGSLDSTFDSDGIVTTNIGSLGYNDIVQAIVLQSDGKIVVAGYSDNGNNSYFSVARYDNSNGLANATEHSSSSAIRMYPNPFSKQTTFEFDVFLDNATVQVYNSLGKMVKETKNIKGRTYTCTRDNLQSGLYYVQIVDEHKFVGTKKIVIID